MGHYYREMHVDTPHEEFLGKVTRELRELGFTNFDVGHKSCFVCKYCSCLIANVMVHFKACKAIPGKVRRDFKSQLLNTRLAVLRQLKDFETERLNLLKQCGAGASAFVLQVVLEGLCGESQISYSQDLTKEFSDRVYKLVEDTAKEG